MNQRVNLSGGYLVELMGRTVKLCWIWVLKCQYLGKIWWMRLTIQDVLLSLSGFDKSGENTYPIATVHCNVDRFSFPLEVAVFDQKIGELLLGRDAGGDRMLQLLVVSRQQPKLVKETRLQKRQWLAEETHLEHQDRLDGAKATLVPSPEEEDDDALTRVTAVLRTKRWSVSASFSTSPPSPRMRIRKHPAQDGESIPTPELVLDEVDNLKTFTMSDPSLTRLWKWADLGEKGYFWKEGVLTNSRSDEEHGMIDRIVFPTSLRKRIVVLAHDHSGHLSVAKMRQMLSQWYTWPGIHYDIQRHCSKCEACNLNRQGRPRATPLQDVPVITEPFEKVAFDLVGPFPIGAKHLLTTICLASKYPDAVPLRDISAESVAEGMIEVWSRTGIPRLVLTDQGSQLLSKLVRQLCTRLGVSQVKTSPYHPQSNGALECFHGTLVPMLRKNISNKFTWTKQLKYCLFALRGMPNRDSGYSPHEVVFGTHLPSPLTFLYDYPLVLL